MTDPVLDFWFDFASTYSYLAAARIRPLAAAAQVCGCAFGPFLLGPIFKAQGWDTSPFNLYEAKGRYMWRDLERLAAGLNLPFRRPDPFPQNSLLPARVALVGLAQGWGEDFCRRRLSARSSSRTAGSTSRTRSREILSVHECRCRRPRSKPRNRTTSRLRLRSETEEAQRLGIFGAPSFTTADGELFWGNDRLEQALAWAKRGA